MHGKFGNWHLHRGLNLLAEAIHTVLVLSITLYYIVPAPTPYLPRCTPNTLCLLTGIEANIEQIGCFITTIRIVTPIVVSLNLRFTGLDK